MQELRLELLLGKPVKDASGKMVGHLEEIRVRKTGDEWVIHEYLIGNAALMERLSIKAIRHRVMLRLGAKWPKHSGFRVPWNKLEVDDPDNLKILGNVEDVCEPLDKPFADKNWFAQGGVTVEKSS